MPSPLIRSATRIRAAAWPCAQSGLAAASAWAFSVHVLHHTRPFFAAVAAVVSLGLQAGQRLRRTAELALGVALGVLIGDALVDVIGSGDWQIGVVIAFALIVAVALGGGPLVVTQSGLQAVFIVALPRAPHSGFHRWQDALVGGGVALAVAALLSTDPWRDARRSRREVTAALAQVLRDAAFGLRSEEPDQVEAALERARGLEPSLARWREALASGRETTRLALLRADRDGYGVGSELLLDGLTRALRNTRVMLRRVVAALRDDLAVPPGLPALLGELAEACDLAGAEDPRPAVEALLRLAPGLDPLALAGRGLSGQAVVGQLRFVTVDLLSALGVPHDRARNALPALVD